MTIRKGDWIDKPWGWEHILELNDRYCIKRLFVKPGHRLSKQYHVRKVETLMLVSGSVNLSLWGSGGEQVTPMAASVPHHIASGVIHRMTGAFPDGGTVLEVSTTELDDVVRLDDDYGRDADRIPAPRADASSNRR
jgi:mannose-6-phosphate isomerase-like protein (cupin superfamily)